MPPLCLCLLLLFALLLREVQITLVCVHTEGAPRRRIASPCVRPPAVCRSTHGCTHGTHADAGAGTPRGKQFTRDSQHINLRHHAAKRAHRAFPEAVRGGSPSLSLTLKECRRVPVLLPLEPSPRCYRVCVIRGYFARPLPPLSTRPREQGVRRVCKRLESSAAAAKKVKRGEEKTPNPPSPQ